MSASGIVGMVLDMRRCRLGPVLAGSVAVLAVGVVVAFQIVDDRRSPAAAPQGQVIGQPTCLAPDVLEAVIPIPVQSPEYLVDPLPPAGTIPESFQPTSVVVCEFLKFADDNSGAILRQTRRSGDLTRVIAELAQPSLDRPWLGECPTASTIPTPVVWLVDAVGHGVRVAFPTGGVCEHPLPEAYGAVMNLAVQEDQVHYLPSAL